MKNLRSLYKASFLLMIGLASLAINGCKKELIAPQEIQAYQIDTAIVSGENMRIQLNASGGLVVGVIEIQDVKICPDCD